MIRKILTFLVIMLVAAWASPAFCEPTAFPTISLTPRISGLTRPVFLTHSGDGSGRIFIVEQTGAIKIFQNGVLLPTPFLNISAKILSAGEQGLLSVAFPPNFAAKQYFYVFYTNVNGNNEVARIAVSANPNVADPASETRILLIPHPTFANHNGGQLAFSPKDLFLYISTGDGGGGGDPRGNGQNPNSLLGKILRIDVESGLGVNKPYKIPPSNPFVNVPGFRKEIWALGLRNPWRFSFDRSKSDLYIADVGQNSFEEVNFQLAASRGGRNYGWNILEGRACFNPPIGCVKPTNYIPPVTTYNHTQGNAVTGGYVYRGSEFPLMAGIYFFGDFGSGRIWGLQKPATVWQRQLLLDTTLLISTFGEDQPGKLYVADYATGTIFEIVSP